ncbi:flagellar protein FliL [bacterium]|nr:flagellar protein FliL [bacterium]
MAEEKKAEQSKKPLNVKLIMMIAFVIVNIGVTGYGAFLVYSSTLGWTSPAITESQIVEEKKKLKEMMSSPDQEGGPLVYTLDKFTVNLSGEPQRSIQIEVNLEMLSKEGFEEIIDQENRARTRDRIVRILNDKTFSELETIQGKLFLKDKIASEVNSILDRGVVKDVYFTAFVVQ